MTKLFYWAAAVAFPIIVAGCSATAPVDGSASAPPSSTKRSGSQTDGKGMAPLDAFKKKNAEGEEEAPLSRTTIYFELDSSEIAPDFREILRAHGNHLVAHPEIHITIEGHTDERGSREYNLALGERRAYAVQQLLMLQGVAADQLEVISFGEERPVSREHDEEAWRLNRRVELRYPSR